MAYTGMFYINGCREIEGSEGHWHKFHDVFDPSFLAAVRRGLAGRKQELADPWCIGFFVDNEMSWGNEVSLALAALASPPDQAAKRVFVDDLKAKYATIAALNAAWGTTHDSWDALLASRDAPDVGRARADLAPFYERLAETYFRTIKEELVSAGSRQLYLGCRFAWKNDVAVRAAIEHCDVVSYNRYAYDVSQLSLPGNADKPLIIGEFHFGALDRGMFHPGLCPARDQRHRAELYRSYVRSALRNPILVGAHWFQYASQATTGRGDGENCQIGFVDICDTSYQETIEAAAEVGRTLYEYRSRHATTRKADP
jgi:hypothetical protein